METITVLQSNAVPSLDAENAAVKDQNVTLTFSNGTATTTTYNEIAVVVEEANANAVLQTAIQTEIARLLNIQ